MHVVVVSSQQTSAWNGFFSMSGPYQMLKKSPQGTHREKLDRLMEKEASLYITDTQYLRIRYGNLYLENNTRIPIYLFFSKVMFAYFITPKWYRHI